MSCLCHDLKNLAYIMSYYGALCQTCPMTIISLLITSDQLHQINNHKVTLHQVILHQVITCKNHRNIDMILSEFFFTIVGHYFIRQKF